MAGSLEERVRSLLAGMDLEDKLAQMRMTGSARLSDAGRFSAGKAEEVFHGRGIGAVECRAIAGPGLPAMGPADCARFFGDLQRFLRTRTRGGIPALVTAETLHGLMVPGATTFPQAIALASCWDADLLEEIAAAIAREASAAGVVQALAPDLDLARDPRWGRVEETYGEDPYLTGRLGVRYVRGLQGPGPGIGAERIVATLKHYAAHGSPEGGVNLSPVPCGERQLRDLFLPPFRAAVREAGALCVMPAYSELDGIPLSSSRRLLTEILRGEWGFPGYTFSDYGAISMLHGFHRTAATPEDAGRQALEAGMDLEAPRTECFGDGFERLVREGRIPMRLVDRAVERILRVKVLAGLFDGRTGDPARAAAAARSPAHRELALRAARESMVLLQNRGGLLPLPPDIESVAVLGPNADAAQLGDYSVDDPDAVSPLSGIRAAVSPRTLVVHERGCGLWEADRGGIAKAVEAARGAKAAVLFLGEASMSNFGVGWGDAEGRAALCGEGFDRDEIGLPGVQQELVDAVIATGTPTVAVLIGGRPLAVRALAERVPAVLEAWYPGQEGGRAVADVLFGAVNPCGRLPVSFPKTAGQIPVFYNHKPSARGYYGRPGTPEKPGRDYVFNDAKPLWPFGHGLSYTGFAYSDLRLSADRIGPAESVRVSVRVRNTGRRSGKEVVQLYVRDVVSSVTTPVKALKGFAKVALEPGEEKTVPFTLGPAELCLVDAAMKETVEPGEFEVQIAGLSGTFTVA